MKIEVKYRDVLVGYTENEGKTIEFLENKTAKQIRSLLLVDCKLGISQRSIGTIDENNNIINEKITEIGLINLEK